MNHDCEICGKCFRDLESHLIKVHGLVKYVETAHVVVKDHNCDSCGKCFTEAGSLRRHVKSIHEGGKNHECDLCGKSFTRAEHLKSHVKTVHEGVKDHKCDSCGKSFTRAESLKTHVKAFHEGGKGFARAGYLQKHIEIVHDGPKSEVFSCNLCRHESKSIGFLNRHKKSHKTCTVCNKMFSGKHSATLLKIHLKKHKPKPPFVKEIHKCEKCNQIFQYKSYLLRHIESHSQKSKAFKLETSTMEKLVTEKIPKIVCVENENSEKVQPNQIVKSRSRKQKFEMREFHDCS